MYFENSSPSSSQQCDACSACNRWCRRNRAKPLRRHAGAVSLVPVPDRPEKQHPQHRREREPCNAALALRQHEERGEQWSDRRTGVAAHLKKCLCEPMAAAGCETRDTRGFRVKDRRSQPDEGRREHDQSEIHAEGEENHSAERERHTRRERVRLRTPVGIKANHRLKKRRRDLIHEGDEADLAEAEPEVLFEDRIDGGKQRLHHVIQKMTEAEAGEDACSHFVRGAECVTSFCIVSRPPPAGKSAHSRHVRGVQVWSRDGMRVATCYRNIARPHSRRTATIQPQRREAHVASPLAI